MSELSRSGRAVRDAFRQLSPQERLNIAADVVGETAGGAQQELALLAVGMGELARRVLERERRAAEREREEEPEYM